MGKIKNNEYIWDYLLKFQEKGCKMKWISYRGRGQDMFEMEEKDLQKEEIQEKI